VEGRWAEAALLHQDKSHGPKTIRIIFPHMILEKKRVRSGSVAGLFSF
jgi:hypothetical protein